MKILRTVIIFSLLFCMGTSNLEASSSFGQYYVAANTQKTYTGIANSANNKTTNANSWYVIATTLDYRPSNSYKGLGMCFSPMVKNGSVYSLCGGSYQWILNASNNPVYGTWKSINKRTYYLGVRLDTDFSGNSGAAYGSWNAK